MIALNILVPTNFKIVPTGLSFILYLLILVKAETWTKIQSAIFLAMEKLMVQKINPRSAPGCDRSPPYYVFSKDANVGSVPSISSEVLGWDQDIQSNQKVVENPNHLHMFRRA